MWLKNKKWSLLAFALLFLAIGVSWLWPQKATATTGTPSLISFEGKIVKSDGTNITDGTYNMEFKIYSGTSNTGVGDTLLFTEDWLVGSGQGGVAFTSGTYAVNIGAGADSVALSSLNFNQYPLWLSVQIGNTSSCTITTTFQSNCGGDGEMTPYLQFTSAPYALNAGQLGGLNASQYVQLSPSSQQTGNINVSGTLQASSTSASIFGNGTTGAVQIGGGTLSESASGFSSNVNLTVQGPTITIQNSTNPDLQINTGSSTGELAIATANGNYSNFAITNDAVLRADTGNLILSARNSTGNVYIGTGAADTAKVTVLSGGNVGVGTTNPSQELTVMNGNILVDANSSGTNGGIILQSSSNYGGAFINGGQINITGTLAGMIINRNTDMLDGTTGYSVYDNSGGGHVTISAVASANAPNSSGQVLQVHYDGTGTYNSNPTPGYGGFYLALSSCGGINGSVNGFCYRPNQRYHVRLMANIPSGYTLTFNTNSMGTGGNYQWLTPQGGTGSWQEYDGIATLGVSGSSTFFWSLSGSAGASAFNWQVASLKIAGLDSSPSTQTTTNLNVGYFQGANLGYGQLLTTADSYLAVSGGNVGIGTTGPNYKLDVNGTAQVQNTFTVTSTTANADIQLNSVSRPSIYETVNNIGLQVRSNGTGVLQLNSDNAATGDTSINGSDIYVQASTSRVGIGTSNPLARLDIGGSSGTAASTAFNINAGSLGTTAGNELAVASLGFRSSNASELGVRAYRASNGTDWTTTNLVLGMDVDNTVRAGAYLTLGNTTRYVGIDTLSPQYSLDVSGDINTSTQYRIGGTAICTSSGCTPASGSGNYIQNGTSPQTANFNITGNGTINGTLSAYGAIQHFSFNNVIAGTAGWFKLGTLSLPQGGYSATINLYGGYGYNAQDSQNAWEDIQVRTSNNSSTNGSGFGAAGNVAQYGNSGAFSNVKLVSNAAGVSATSYDVYVYTNTFVGVGYYTVDLNGGSWANVMTTATDPGANSSTVYALPFSLTTMGQLTVTTTGASILGSLGVGSTNQFQVDASGNLSTSGTANVHTTSTSALQVQNAGSVALLTADTSNQQVIVRSGSGNAVEGGNLYSGFNAISGWTNSGSGASMTSTHTNGGGTTALTTTWTATSGSTYEISYSDIFCTASSLGVSIGPYGGQNIESSTSCDGNNDVVITANNNGALTFTPGNTYSGTVTINFIKAITTQTNSVLTVQDNGGVATLEVRSSAGGNQNTFIGLNSGTNNTSSGQELTALGYGTLQNNTTGNANTAVGALALQNNSNGSGNSALGYNALQVNTSGSNNSAFGNAALQLNVNGANNTAVGQNALNGNTVGNWNTAVGTGALQGNSTGAKNTALGYQALSSNASGVNNTAVGYNALQQNFGTDNTAAGFAALAANTSGNYNTAFGDSALMHSTASYNSAFGYNSLQANTTGDYNSALGYYSMLNNTGGWYNSGFGYLALAGNTTGYYNSSLGFEAGYQDSSGNFKTLATLQNATAIGAYAQVQANNSIVLGSVDTTTSVGIGTTIPLNTFSVSPLDYNTGTACSTATSGGTSCAAGAFLFGTGTTWTNAMIGDQVIFADGQTATITAFTSATAVSLSASINEATGSYYRFHHLGLQVTSSGNVEIGSQLMFNGQTTAGDPTCTPGAIYYNASATDGEFRACRKDTTGTANWYNLIAGVDVQTFTASGTWTKPSGVTVSYVLMCGSGGGGGGGAFISSNSYGYGGGGGGGGVFVDKYFASSELTSTVAVTIGAGGGGGNKGTGGVAGSPGGNGGTTTFGSYLTAYGGLGGGGGNATPNGGAGAGIISGDAVASGNGAGWQGGASNSGSAEHGGGGGGIGNTGTFGGGGGYTAAGGGAGGGGGGYNNGGITGNRGGPGGSSNGASGGSYGNATNGTSGQGFAGAAGTAANTVHCGSGGGGGGGAYNSGGNGGLGGTGGGGGGGGGGDGPGTGSSGFGASGGSGEAWVFSW